MSSAVNNVESAIVAGNSSPLLGSTDPSGSETHHALASGSDIAFIYPHLLPFNPYDRIESREYKLTPFSRSAYFTPPSSPGRAAIEASGAIIHEIDNSVFPHREVLDGLGITGLGLESNMRFLNLDYEEVFENEKQAEDDDSEDVKEKDENRISDEQYLAIHRAFMDMQSMDLKMKNETFEADSVFSKFRTNTTESNYGGFADNDYANEYNYEYLYNLNNDDENEVNYDAKYNNFKELASACYPSRSSAWSSSAFSSTSVGSSEEASTFVSTSFSTTFSFPVLDAPFRCCAGAPASGNGATGTVSSKSTSEGYYSDCEVSHPCFSSFSLSSDDNLSDASTSASPVSGSAAGLVGSGSYKWDSTPYTPLKISFKKDNKRKRDPKDELDSMLECASSSTSDSSSFFSSCRQSMDDNNGEDNDDEQEIKSKKQKKTKAPYVESEAVKKLKLSPALKRFNFFTMSAMHEMHEEQPHQAIYTTSPELPGAPRLAYALLPSRI